MAEPVPEAAVRPRSEGQDSPPLPAADNTPSKGTRAKAAAKAAAAAAAEAGNDLRILSPAEAAAAEAAKGKAPDAPAAAIIAMIQHAQETGYKVKEGTGTAAEKREAWNKMTDVFNEAAKQTGVTYVWSSVQVKNLFNNKKDSFAKWYKQAGEYKSGREAYWTAGEGKGKKPYFYDAMHSLLGERAATAPPKEMEVGAGLEQRGAQELLTLRAGLAPAARLSPTHPPPSAAGEPAPAAKAKKAKKGDVEDPEVEAWEEEMLGEAGDLKDADACLDEQPGADTERTQRRKSKADARAKKAGGAKAAAERIKDEEKKKAKAAKKEDAEVAATALASAFGPLFGGLTKTLEAAVDALKAGKRKMSRGGSSGKGSHKAATRMEESDESGEEPESSR